MAAILVSYDLNTPGQKYDALYEKLKAYGTYARVVESTWIVVGSALTPQGVYADLRKVLDDSDYFFVVEITDSLRQGWLPQTTWDWIKKYV